MRNRLKQKTIAFSVTQLHGIFFVLCSVLTLVLYLHGGATNPFVSLYLVPIAISAATLSTRFTVALALFCLLAYSFLMFYYQPMQLLSPSHQMSFDSAHHSMHIGEDQGVNWHVAGMWLNFVVSAVLITWFGLRMASALRHRDAQLAAVREQQLRDEQLLGIATLAAGTLHELGTPLATMTLLTEELETSAQDYPELADDITLLAQQLARCKRSLHNLARAAEQPSDQLRRESFGDYLDKVLMHWHLLQPGVALKNLVEPLPVFIRVDSTCEQAIINLLTNAAEASPAGIEISAGTDAATDMLTIAIRDYGPGIALDAATIGKPFVSTRGQGRGLGLFLSNASIERLGGRVGIQAHPAGGTLTTITLPYTQ
jgi:two-component system, sensor histidine kinase RegB